MTKRKVNKLISKFLEEIGHEVTEISVDPETGEDRLISKVEALARQIWQRALGKFETLNMKTGVREELPPDKDMIQLIMDRLEGKVAAQALTSAETESIAEKISRSGVEKLNKIANSSFKS